ncbi:hypothetical protein [Vibrio phage LV6]|nr:hypothetical protein [Vibrio phage LV6]
MKPLKQTTGAKILKAKTMLKPSRTKLVNMVDASYADLETMLCSKIAEGVKGHLAAKAEEDIEQLLHGNFNKAMGLHKSLLGSMHHIEAISGFTYAPKHTISSLQAITDHNGNLLPLVSNDVVEIRHHYGEYHINKSKAYAKHGHKVSELILNAILTIKDYPHDLAVVELAYVALSQCMDDVRAYFLFGKSICAYPIEVTDTLADTLEYLRKKIHGNVGVFEYAAVRGRLEQLLEQKHNNPTYLTKPPKHFYCTSSGTAVHSKKGVQGKDPVLSWSDPALAASFEKAGKALTAFNDSVAKIINSKYDLDVGNHPLNGLTSPALTMVGDVPYLQLPEGLTRTTRDKWHALYDVLEHPHSGKMIQQALDGADEVLVAVQGALTRAYGHDAANYTVNRIIKAVWVRLHTYADEEANAKECAEVYPWCNNMPAKFINHVERINAIGSLLAVDTPDNLKPIWLTVKKMITQYALYLEGNYQQVDKELIDTWDKFSNGYMVSPQYLLAIKGQINPLVNLNTEQMYERARVVLKHYTDAIYYHSPEGHEYTAEYQGKEYYRRSVNVVANLMVAVYVLFEEFSDTFIANLLHPFLAMANTTTTTQKHLPALEVGLCNAGLALGFPEITNTMTRHAVIYNKPHGSADPYIHLQTGIKTLDVADYLGESIPKVSLGGAPASSLMFTKSQYVPYKAYPMCLGLYPS